MVKGRTREEERKRPSVIEAGGRVQVGMTSNWRERRKRGNKGGRRGRWRKRGGGGRNHSLSTRMLRDAGSRKGG